MASASQQAISTPLHHASEAQTNSRPTKLRVSDISYTNTNDLSLITNEFTIFLAHKDLFQLEPICKSRGHFYTI
jgi:hypothetical protein